MSSGYYLLEGKTKLSMQQAHRNIPYKYVVVRAKKNELWECLIGFKPVVSGHVNRCLSIPEPSIKSNGECIGLSWHMLIVIALCQNRLNPSTDRKHRISCSQVLRRIDHRSSYLIMKFQKILLKYTLMK